MEESLIKVAYNGKISTFTRIDNNIYAVKDIFYRNAFKTVNYYSLAKFITVGQVGERYKEDDTYYYCVRDVTNDLIIFIYFDNTKMKILNVQ